MTKHFRSRYPCYPDDSDYKTNAPSYYEDLARKNKLIEILAEKIYGYEKVLAENLAEIERVLNAVIDKIGEGFNQEIVELLEQWIVDGTLDHIINETLMNKKADKTELQALETALNNAMTLLETTLIKQMNQLETDTNNNITQLETVTNDKMTQLETETNVKLENLIKHSIKNTDLIFYHMQKRKRISNKSHVSVQGSCFLGGKGNNIEYALAMLPTDGNPNNIATILTTKGNNLIQEQGGSELKLYHANGMDLNPDTDTIYVSHTNKQVSNGFEYENNVSEITKDGSRILRTISPKNLPSNRRVKYFTVDKKTGKKYLGDDKGIYEVDNDLNISKTIDFSKEFTEKYNWGVGQTAVVHNNLIFYLVMGMASIAIFNLKGELITLFEIPKFTKEGSFTGVEPESLFFDNDDNLFLVNRYGEASFDLDYYYTKVFKLPLFNGKVSDHFIGTHNTRTINTIYVDNKTSSAFSNGSKNYPFVSLDEAVTYIRTASSQKGFEVEIIMKEGVYKRSTIRTNGLAFVLKGEGNVVIDNLRFYNTTVRLENINFNRQNGDYCLGLYQSTATLKGVKMNSNNGKYGGYIVEGSILYGINGYGNIVENSQTGYYLNGAMIIGNVESFGITFHDNPISLSSSGFAPLIQGV